MTPEQRKQVGVGRQAAPGAMSVRSPLTHTAALPLLLHASVSCTPPTCLPPASPPPQLLLEKLSDEWGTDLPLIEHGTHRYVCPACGNGAHGDDAFAVTLTDDWVKWCCHRASCGYSGSVYVYGGRHADTQSVAAAAGIVADAARSTGLGGTFQPGTREQHVLQQLQAEQQQQEQAAMQVRPLQA